MKKEIKCQFCGKTFNMTDLKKRTVTTDKFLGLNWGVPSWEEYEEGYCPNCMRRLMVDNKKIEYQINKEIK